MKKDKCYYTIYKTKCEHNVIFQGHWKAVARYERSQDVKIFLKKRKVMHRYVGCAFYQTEPDSIGCYDLYKIDVHFELEKEEKK
ncbi:MAG: hypothetical protein RLZZ74_3461 [Cyanobacteriota bacterium]|jgi:hypothetical protein